MEFEWDEEKARSNLKKHGISFLYATGVFSDRERFEKPESDVEYEEERWLTIGLVEAQELVVISVTRGVKARLISARRATKHERNEYWANRNFHA